MGNISCVHLLQQQLESDGLLAEQTHAVQLRKEYTIGQGEPEWVEPFEFEVPSGLPPSLKLDNSSDDFASCAARVAA